MGERSEKNRDVGDGAKAAKEDGGERRRETNVSRARLTLPEGVCPRFKCVAGLQSKAAAVSHPGRDLRARATQTTAEIRRSVEKCPRAPTSGENVSYLVCFSSVLESGLPVYVRLVVLICLVVIALHKPVQTTLIVV